MPTRRQRRLTDLFVRGDEFEFDDGAHDPIKVWLQKENPLEHDLCIKRGQAAKAKYLRVGDDHDSDDWLSVYLGIREYDDQDGLISVIISKDVIRARLRIEAELASDDEWAKDGYLQALRDRWEGDADNVGLKRTYFEDPEDAEAQRVFKELQRFDDLANLELNAERQALRDAWDGADQEAIWEAATTAMLERKAEDLFINEYTLQQIYYGTRCHDDHSKRYFGTVDEVRECDSSIQVQLSIALDLMAVDALEGKDLPETPDSSDSSAAIETVEVSPDSGLVESTQ